MVDMYRRVYQDQRQSGSDGQGANGTLIGRVNYPEPNSDRVNVLHARGPSSKLVNHPFVGTDAWIRAMPDEGSQVLLMKRGDIPEWEIARSYHQSSSARIENYGKRINTFRPLLGGEFDMQSTGHAGIFGSDRGQLEFRAAGLYGGLDRDEATIYWKSPVFNIRGATHKVGSVADEIRFGVVVRPSLNKPKTISKFISNGSWAKEYLRHIGSKNDPTVLVDYREGDVYEDDGTTSNHSVTGKPNRIRAIYGHSGGTKTQWQLDNVGNMLVQFPASGEEGLQIQQPGGSFVHRIGKNAKWFIGDHGILTTGQNLQVAVGENAEVGASSSMLISGGSDTAIRGKGLAGGLHVSNLILGSNAQLDTLGSMTLRSIGPMSVAASTFSLTTNSPAYINANPIYLGKTASISGQGLGVARLGDKTVISAIDDTVFWGWIDSMTVLANAVASIHTLGAIAPILSRTISGRITTASSNTFTD